MFIIAAIITIAKKRLAKKTVQVDVYCPLWFLDQHRWGFLDSRGGHLVH